MVTVHHGNRDNDDNDKVIALVLLERSATEADHHPALSAEAIRLYRWEENKGTSVARITVGVFCMCEGCTCDGHTGMWKWNMPCNM